MSLSELALVAEIVSAVTVLVSIVYLALQVRQNTASIEAQAFQTWVTSRSDLQSKLNEPDMAAIVYNGMNDPLTLDGYKWFKFGSWWLSWFQILTEESIRVLLGGGPASAIKALTYVTAGDDIDRIVWK